MSFPSLLCPLGYDEGFTNHWVVAYNTVPDMVIPNERKQEAFGPAIQFIKDVHVKHGFEWA